MMERLGYLSACLLALILLASEATPGDSQNSNNDTASLDVRQEDKGSDGKEDEADGNVDSETYGGNITVSETDREAVHHQEVALVALDYGEGQLGHRFSENGYGPDPYSSDGYAKGHGLHFPTFKEPSVVLRNPNDHFDIYDAIRTRDKDHRYRGINKDVLTSHFDLFGEQFYAFMEAKQKGYFKGLTYDSSKSPECAYGNQIHYNLTFCLEDPFYPTDFIRLEIARQRHLVDRLLSDITYQSADNLVDGLTRAEEEGYTYEHYYGVSHDKHDHSDAFKPPYNGYSYSHDYYKKGGYVCPSNIFYTRPKRAKNTYGKWKLIINLPDEHRSTRNRRFGFGKYTQTQRLEKCIYANAPCSYVDHIYQSQCLQKYNFVRLLAFSPEEGFHIDTFKLPTACSCHVSHYEYQPHPYVYGNVPSHPRPEAYAHVLDGSFLQEQPPYTGFDHGR